MSIIVTETGFEEDGWEDRIIEMDDLAVSDTAGHAVNFPVDGDLSQIQPFFDRLAMIRIPFSSFADGRGFSVAQHLRIMGFDGTIRAAGDIVSDQFKHARRVGIDEVEISNDLAKRQPQAEWIVAAKGAGTDYRAQLAARG